MRTLTLFSLLWVFLFAAPASAKVSSMPIGELVTGTEEIVIATVTDVSSKPAPDMKPIYASAVVQRTLKGSLAGAFRLWAYPTWTCDISEAVKGETVLLFLRRGGVSVELAYIESLITQPKKANNALQATRKGLRLLLTAERGR